MLISEDTRKQICTIAKEICADPKIIKSYPNGLDENKVAYLIETLIANDIIPSNETILETAQALFDEASTVA